MATEKIESGGEMEFDPEQALAHAQATVMSDGQVSLPHYIGGIEQMYRLFTKFEGQNVEFILSGLDVKLNILKELLNGEAKDHYSTVQSMVTYEQQNNLVEREDKPSGTQTVLRINRMLEFVCAGLEKINDLAIPDATLSEEIVEAYTSTLGRFHPPLMVASIQWALPHVVPSRAALVAEIGLNSEDVTSAAAWMMAATQGIRKLYDAVQKVYADHGLLNLSQGSI